MSFMNLLGALLCPDYDGLYLVESSVLDEARRAMPDSKFPTTVGRLVEMSTEDMNLMPCTFRGVHGIAAKAEVASNGSSLRIAITKVSKASQDQANDDGAQIQAYNQQTKLANLGKRGTTSLSSSTLFQPY
jgi:hypothetical protein